MKKAIVLGASGLTGSLLLHKLLAHSDYQQVLVFNRKPLGISHTKLKEYVGNVVNLNEFELQFVADEVFCCIGTTAKKTPDKLLYHQIDFGIPLQAAQLCKANNINTLAIVSAMGANSKSSIFYNRTKGEMEEAVLALNIPHTYLLQPSLIVGNRNEKRFAEAAATYFMKLINPILIGSFKKYKSINAEAIAEAMVILARTKPATTRIESDKIIEIAKAL
jgi:uncharacterized protein YbjT (DUF2867 family)